MRNSARKEERDLPGSGKTSFQLGERKPKMEENKKDDSIVKLSLLSPREKAWAEKRLGARLGNKIKTSNLIRK